MPGWKLGRRQGKEMGRIEHLGSTVQSQTWVRTVGSMDSAGLGMERVEEQHLGQV